jgi:hypothetical protein
MNRYFANPARRKTGGDADLIGGDTLFAEPRYACGGGSSAQTQQTSQQSQVAVQGSGNFTIGSGTTLNLGGGGTATGSNQNNNPPGRGSNSGNLPGVISPTGGGNYNAITVTTSDINAIELAAHVADLNATVTHDATASALASGVLTNAASAQLAATAIASNADNTRQVLAANNQILNTAANVIGTSEAENAHLAQAAITGNQGLVDSAIAGVTSANSRSLDAVTQAHAQELALYQQGLTFANSVANQALTIAGNATPQSAGATAELLAGSSPLSGAVAATAPLATSAGVNWTAIAGLAAAAGAVYLLISKAK